MKGGEIAVKVNQVLLGLVMLIPGLYKLFVLGPSAVVAMLESFGFPVALLFAWLLIVSEIFFGAAVILVLAGLLAYRNDYPSLLLHFVTASNFVAFGMMHKK